MIQENTGIHAASWAQNRNTSKPIKPHLCWKKKNRLVSNIRNHTCVGGSNMWDTYRIILYHIVDFVGTVAVLLKLGHPLQDRHLTLLWLFFKIGGSLPLKSTRHSETMKDSTPDLAEWIVADVRWRLGRLFKSRHKLNYWSIDWNWLELYNQ